MNSPTIKNAPKIGGVSSVTLLLVLSSVAMLGLIFIAPTLHLSLVKSRHQGQAMEHPDLVPDALDGLTGIVKDIKGDNVDLHKLGKDKMVLIVNVASHCGFTDLNYRELQAMQHAYADDLLIVAFPCNQFGNQEADAPVAIEAFARKTKGATFPLMEKVEVNGPGAHPLYVKLKAALHVKEIEWNFGKFLLAKGGVPLKYYDHRFPFEVLKRQVDQLVRL